MGNKSVLLSTFFISELVIDQNKYWAARKIVSRGRRVLAIFGENAVRNVGNIYKLTELTCVTVSHEVCRFY